MSALFAADTRCVRDGRYVRVGVAWPQPKVAPKMSESNSNQYLRNAILQASPEQLQLMLYDGAIRFALKGREAMESRDFEGVYEHLSRAQKIVLEMEAGLRPEVHRELCEQMSALYQFVYRKLVDASVHKKIEDVDAALDILRHQRETWRLLLEKVSQEAEAPHPTGAHSADPNLMIPAEGTLSVQC